MSHTPVADGRRRTLLLPRGQDRPADDIVVIEPEFAAGPMAAFPEVRLVRQRCVAGAGPCEARCPAGSRRIAAGEERAGAAWAMCA